MRRLNLGAGDIKLDGIESQDVDSKFNPDHCFDLKVFPWPLESNSFDEIYFFHCIEHIEKKYHRTIFFEIRRLLTDDGRFFLSFPEFEIVAKNWLENVKGQREFWENTIFGRQATPSDFHVCAMDYRVVIELLNEVGFKDFEAAAEDAYEYNTVIRCTRGEPVKSYEELVYQEVIK